MNNILNYCNRWWGKEQSENKTIIVTVHKSGVNDRKGNIVENQVSDFKDQLLDDKVKTDTQKLRMKLWRLQKVWQSSKNIFKGESTSNGYRVQTGYNRLSRYFKEVSDWKDLKNLLEKSPTSRHKTANFNAKENIWKLLTEE